MGSYPAAFITGRYSGNGKVYNAIYANKYDAVLKIVKSIQASDEEKKSARSKSAQKAAETRRKRLLEKKSSEIEKDVLANRFLQYGAICGNKNCKFTSFKRARVFVDCFIMNTIRKIQESEWAGCKVGHGFQSGEEVFIDPEAYYIDESGILQVKEEFTQKGIVYQDEYDLED
jgi:2-iminoacetate synthase ThiH